MFLVGLSGSGVSASRPNQTQSGGPPSGTASLPLVRIVSGSWEDSPIFNLPIGANVP